MTFTHDSYTVAWICALPLELAAVKVFLDEVHPRLHQQKSDHNVYTLGSIGGHNIVVVCLPAGVYGTTSATAAVAYLKSTYPNIQFALMVGIGGGVPLGNLDIRLGDIVVSKPSDTFGGVIQYDYGKTVGNGHFHHTGSLNKPPPILLKTVAQMESDYMLGKISLCNIMASSLHKEEVQTQFSRPSKDQLFQLAYDHVGNKPDCSACDTSELVDRPERTTEEPQVHYGLIASGNQVMKDARTRDSIAQGRNILCFEMEAAGLMDEIPSLVIRGICDYCDSHKHKEWQGYAAFAAAAYAKALLTLIPIYGQGAVRNGIKKDPHWMVPFRKNPGFVGREEEISRIDGLTQEIHGPFKIAICGLGGVGKTQIALELAYRTRERDPEISIFWIPCTSYASVEQACMNIAQLVGMQGLKPGEAKDRVKSYLSQGGPGRWLLIFDNADDMDMWVGVSAAAAGLADFIPQSDQGRILFTTRNRKLAVNLASSSVIEVLEPDIQTGLKILEKALIRKDLVDDRDVALALLEQLMFLPLAIIQAAAYINSNDIGVSNYITLLQEQEPDVIDLLSEDFGDDARYQEIQNPVATTWLISFQKIQESNPLATEYLSFMACLNPREIPQSLIPPAKSRKDKLEAIGLLKGFAFVSEQVQDHALSLHRLVRLSARNWLRQHRQFHQQIQKTADHLDRVFPDNDHAYQKLWRDYLPHAISLLDEKEFKEGLVKYAYLVQKVGRCLSAEGRYKEAAAIIERLISKQRAGEEEKDEDDDNDANTSTLISLSDLAITYRRQGRWKEAEELNVQVLESSKQLLGSEHPATLTSMVNLACTYMDQGQWKEAEELGVQVLELRKQVLGPEHPDILQSMAGLASMYWQQGRWKEAEELNVQVLESSKQLLGPEHPETLATMANLALTYWKQGRWKEAEKLNVQVLEIYKQALGPEHPDTLTNMVNLACTYMDQGQWKEAEELGVQVLELRKQVLGPEHPATLQSMDNLALTWQQLGRRKETEELHLQVFELRKQLLGPQHPDTLQSMAGLASMYWQQGRWKEAEELGVQVLELRKQVLGPEHPDTLQSMDNLALTWQQLGRRKETEELHLQVFELRKQSLDPQHPDTLQSMVILALTYGERGRWKEAEELGVQVLELRKQVLGPEHPDTLQSMGILAFTYQQQGQWKEAEELEVQVLELRKQVLGPEHPQTLQSMNNLAHTWHSERKVHDALALMERCVELRIRVLGSSHPDSESSSYYLKDWKEEANLLIDECPQDPSQAESAQHAQDTREGNSPALLTEPSDENGKYTPYRQTRARSGNPIQQFLGRHPLVSFRSSSPELRVHNLHEVD